MAAAEKERSSPIARRAAGRRELTVFTRQLATLLKAGMPLVRALEALARQRKNRAFRAVLSEAIGTIRAGGNFSDGLARHPRTFDRLYVNMLRAGEAGGALVVVLERLAAFMEKSERVRSRVKGAMAYPAVIVAVSIAIVSGLMTFVVPKFQGIFLGLFKGQPLPPLTQAVLAASNMVREHLVLVTALLAASGLLAAWIQRTPPGRRLIDQALIRTPLLGDLFLKAAVARFARTFGTLLASGVPMLRALALTRETAGNTRVAAAIARVHDRVKEGDSVARPLRAAGIFPEMVAGMVEVGEETGALPEMLARVAEACEEDVDNAVASLTSLIEPAMIVAMALVVGTIVIALFLPIIRIVQLLS
ncbi:MAG TPA: type II secretion system F family protein [Opitutaceae bacterium]|nr:type II secretion system F family protein [Opitutaceae bacterium]